MSDDKAGIPDSELFTNERLNWFVDYPDAVNGWHAVREWLEKEPNMPAKLKAFLFDWADKIAPEDDKYGAMGMDASDLRVMLGIRKSDKRPNSGDFENPKIANPDPVEVFMEIEQWRDVQESNTKKRPSVVDAFKAYTDQHGVVGSLERVRSWYKAGKNVSPDQ